MKNYIEQKPIMLCLGLFAICLAARIAEYFVIQTDRTILGENLIHKIVGIVVIAFVLRTLHLKWKDIGFEKKGAVKNFLKGVFLGSICFGVSYAVEMTMLNMQGNVVHLELYTNSFSITGSQTKNTEILFFVLCIAFNIINVYMEEGFFRGLCIKIISDKSNFVKANLIAALLFGVWHFVMPIRSYVDGDMTFLQMSVVAIGYVLLSGLMSIKWGLLYKISGDLWIGIGDHLFNNAVATNMLHVVTDGGADEMQIMRIALAQLISFSFVIVLYLHKQKMKNC